MLKFVKSHLETIDGVATYPMISLVIFFLFFTALFWWVFTASKGHLKEMSELPLDDQQPNPSEK